MSSWTRILVMAVAVLLSGCRTIQNPVPVVGDLSLLAGEWSGDYEGVDNDRSGSIVFRLDAGRDTAFGDVLMVPRGHYLALQPVEVGVRQSEERLPTRLLTIAFLRAGESRVSGTLDPYQHPDCGCTLITTFSGEIVGDRIIGTYITRTPAGGIEQGKWQVRKRRSPEVGVVPIPTNAGTTIN